MPEPIRSPKDFWDALRREGHCPSFYPTSRVGSRRDRLFALADEVREIEFRRKEEYRAVARPNTSQSVIQRFAEQFGVRLKLMLLWFESKYKKRMPKTNIQIIERAGLMILSRALGHDRRKYAYEVFRTFGVDYLSDGFATTMPRRCGKTFGILIGIIIGLLCIHVTLRVGLYAIGDLQSKQMFTDILKILEICAPDIHVTSNMSNIYLLSEVGRQQIGLVVFTKENADVSRMSLVGALDPGNVNGAFIAMDDQGEVVYAWDADWRNMFSGDRNPSPSEIGRKIVEFASIAQREYFLKCRVMIIEDQNVKPFKALIMQHMIEGFCRGLGIPVIIRSPSKFKDSHRIIFPYTEDMVKLRASEKKRRAAKIKKPKRRSKEEEAIRKSQYDYNKENAIRYCEKFLSPASHRVIEQAIEDRAARFDKRIEETQETKRAEISKVLSRTKRIPKVDFYDAAMLALEHLKLLRDWNYTLEPADEPVSVDETPCPVQSKLDWRTVVCSPRIPGAQGTEESGSRKRSQRAGTQPPQGSRARSGVASNKRARKSF